MTVAIYQIIEQCKRRLRPAQEQFYRHFYAYAMSICMPYSQSTFEAEEIANDGFMKIFKKIDTYDPRHPIEAWIRRIMINSAIDYFRSQRKHYHQLNIDEAKSSPQVDADIIDQLSAEEIMKHVQGLPPAYRTVFTLATIEGYKHQEIAKALNISEGTSKSNLAKAKAHLKKTLSQGTLKS